MKTIDEAGGSRVAGATVGLWTLLYQSAWVDISNNPTPTASASRSDFPAPGLVLPLLVALRFTEVRGATGAAVAWREASGSPRLPTNRLEPSALEGALAETTSEPSPVVCCCLERGRGGWLPGG